VTGEIADWNDDAVYRDILRLLNERQMQGDVPLNLTATSLINPRLLVYRRGSLRTWCSIIWKRWHERINANGGLCPDKRWS